jgi:cytoskeletal protein RodZ
VELIEDEKEVNGVLPEPEPRYHTATLPEGRTEHGQSLVRLAVAIVAGIILIILIVLLARWIYHAAHNSEPTPTPAPSVSAPSTSSPDQKQPSDSNSGSAPTASPNNQSSSATTKLPNNGPGDVVGIFIGASLAAAGLHYIVSLRRFVKDA